MKSECFVICFIFFGRVNVRVFLRDITKNNTDAIVNAAPPSLDGWDGLIGQLFPRYFHEIWNTGEKRIWREVIYRRKLGTLKYGKGEKRLKN